MMDTLETLIDILEMSVKKNGADKVLTVGHLLNILKMAERRAEDSGECDDLIAAACERDTW